MPPAFCSGTAWSCSRRKPWRTAGARSADSDAAELDALGMRW